MKDEYYRIYQILLRSTFDIFKDVFFSGELEVSDDGYWDLRSTIIGYGKNFLYDPSKKTRKSLACVMNLTKSNSNLVLKYIV